jgi:transcriptional regulator with XRE-family HTH domain
MEPMKNRLKELREEQGLSQADIASLTGKKTSITVDRWEKGAVPIPDSAKRQLSDRFGVTVEYLLGWDREQAAA